MYRTEQELFWASEFGDSYIERNQGEKLLASNLNFFTKALSQARNVQSIMEFGANIGMNLKSLSLLFPSMEFKAVEINAAAAAQLENVIPKNAIQNCSIFDAKVDPQVDLSLIKGVLIHINPDHLNLVYEKLYTASRKYILVAEYYNPSPVTIPYRGHSDRLFKRDFAGELMVKYPDLELVDYGFAYRNDPVFPQDDITWFLLSK